MFTVRIELGGAKAVIRVPALPRPGDRIVAPFEGLPRWFLIVREVWFHPQEDGECEVHVMTEKNDQDDFARRHNALLDQQHHERITAAGSKTPDR